MKTKLFPSMVTPVLAVLVAATFPAVAGADSLMHARVSFESGGALVMGTDDDDWSFATLNTLILPGDMLWADNGATLELELDGGTFVRLADGSKLEVAQMGRDMLFNGWTGAFYVHRVKRSTGNVRLQTPACAVEIEKDSLVRIDVVGEGATTVSVRWGRAQVHTDIGRPVTVREGKRTFVDPGFLPSTPLPFDRNAEDEFDAWNRDRAQLLALGDAPFPKKTVVKEVPVGYADLTPYGEWVYVDSEPYWRPTVVVDYVPYRYGHWSYVPAYGYNWIGNYPFSYVTCHYGRWRHHDTHGWIWTYRDTWSPAWVASARYGSNFVWCPLDIYDRPCVVSGASFTVGNVHFSVFSSTACLVSDLYYGPCSVYACTPGIVTGVPHSQINIWNIYSPTYRRPHLPVFGSPSLVRDYSPRRVIRGPDTYGIRSTRATSRVATLESASGRGEFRTVRSTGSRGLRTPFTSASRTARVRPVSVNSDARLNTHATISRIERGRTPAESSIASRGVRSLRTTSPTTSSSTTPSRTTRTTSGSSIASIRDRSAAPSTTSPRQTTRTTVNPSTTHRSRTSVPSTPSRTTRPSVTSTPSRTTRPSVTSTPSRTTRPSVTSTPSRTTRPSTTSTPSRTTRPSVTSTPSRTTRPSVTDISTRTTRPSVSTPTRTTRTTTRSTTQSSTHSRTPSVTSTPSRTTRSTPSATTRTPSVTSTPSRSTRSSSPSWSSRSTSRSSSHSTTRSTPSAPSTPSRSPSISRPSAPTPSRSSSISSRSSSSSPSRTISRPSTPSRSSSVSPSRSSSVSPSRSSSVTHSAPSSSRSTSSTPSRSLSGRRR